jgi:hypothetical protein
MDSPFKKRMLQPAFLFFSALPPGGQRPRNILPSSSICNENVSTPIKMREQIRYLQIKQNNRYGPRDHRVNRGIV